MFTRGSSLLFWSAKALISETGLHVRHANATWKTPIASTCIKNEFWFSTSVAANAIAKGQGLASSRATASLLPDRSFAASTARALGSGAVLAGCVAGVRTMLTHTSVGHALALSAMVVAGMNTVGFVITAITKSHKITDLTGTTAFIGSVWATHALHCSANNLGLLQPSKSLLLAAMVSLWGARLAGYLFSRVLQVGKDARLDGFFPKDSSEPWIAGESKFPLKLAGFWATQGLWAWTVCLPVTVAHAAMGGGAMGAVAWTGAAAWALGLTWEAVADYQKSAFKKDPSNKGKFCYAGLWSLSRYPNYFGEITLWTGLYVAAAFPALWLKYPWVAVSPGFTALLLLFVSGIPLTEESQQERYGAQPKYQEYKARTNLLLPGPKGSAKNQ